MKSIFSLFSLFLIILIINNDNLISELLLWPEHPTYCSIERKNGIHNNCVGFSVTLNKKLAKKVDVAISYSPNCDEDLLLYLLICEGKKPDYIGNDDYDKLIRSMNDCCNSCIIYYCKKAEQLSKNY